MKAKFRSFMSLLLVAALVITLIPGGLARAAEVTTSFFNPDNKDLRESSQYRLDNSAGTDKMLDRNKAYKVTSGNLTITGSYMKVAGSSLSAEVQQLNLVNGTWVPDNAKVAPGSITLSGSSNESRFSSNVTLYSGMNMITFSGQQGSLTRSETFYVLFDEVPYTLNLQALGDTQPITLNEGAQVVIAAEKITLQGNAQNITKATVQLNGGTVQSTSLLQDGTFFSPELTLKAGLNDLQVVIENGSNTVKSNYKLYYYNKDNPFTELGIRDASDSSAKALSLLNAELPVWTSTAAPVYVGQILIPDNGKDFAVDGTIVFDLPASGTGGIEAQVVGTEAVIPGTSSSMPSYRLVNFQSKTAVPFETTAAGAVEEPTQHHKLTLTYGGTTYKVERQVNYTYKPGQIVIDNLYYLPDYVPGDAKTAASRVALNGAKVSKSDFYIEVDTNSAPGSLELIAKYLPTSKTPIQVELIGPINSDPTKLIYRITNFQNGSQTVRFMYSGSSYYRDVKIAYTSQSYIYVENLQDGQTYEMNSKAATDVPVKGEYIGFNLTSANFDARLYVNGVEESASAADGGSVPGFLNDVKSDGKFSFNLRVSAANGPLVFGENRIVMTGTAKNADGTGREIRKEMRIYIVDTNVSNVSNFQPAKADGRVSMPDMDEIKDNTFMTQFFNLTTDFIYNNSKYTTSLKEHDLIARGNGAETLSISQGTNVLFTAAIPDTPGTTSSTFVYNKQNLKYTIVGSQDNFVLRVEGLSIETPGSYFYTFNLINKTGAKTSQKIEVVREVSAYRLLSPQPSVDGKYVVTRNYIHFDIEAEGAKGVKIGKDSAIPRPDLGPNRFTYDFVGLKQDKNTTIKFTIDQVGKPITGSVDVYYTGTVAVDASYMAPKVANKYTVFNKGLQLSFPKGTVLESKTNTGIAKYYPDTKLLFGIADPRDGVVERRNDYGNLIGFPGTGVSAEETNLKSWSIPDEYLLRFNSVENTRNFGLVSNVYWVSGGMGERGNQGDTSYIPPTNGIAPYSAVGLFGDSAMSSERIVKPTQRGELTLSYDKNVVDEVGSTITVFHYGPDRQWENVGGEVNSKAHTITVPFDEFGYYKVVKLSRGYSDITNHGWARNILNGMYAKGLMNNLRFEQFGTDDQTTRGEFATLLVKGLQLPINSDNKQTFVDLVPGAKSTTWSYDYIETAARAGIVTGLTDGVFAPDQPLTREQAAVMIARALKLKTGTNDDKLKAAAAKAFVDSVKADTYALPSIMAVNSAKIMTGSAVAVPGQKKASYNFNPKSNLTRAEAAKIAVSLLQKSTGVFPKNFG
ncbi:S-layer homology domain-containing protein [Saccharibacillus alkalitolerans]|uniref:S-layer homology domain-containing protein n=1 Tax=Saccharibacillus alkalitolerans TaxID=2705290 RepID=A0ABX0F746_9BACL|nr:S-layer homology domain-containing protein [Saccharibacillus alkalitolerans]NGZ76138.1 S-layer homology domain-containing protein [Saccharibacillus alkalitolerans]